jgi:pilus assembly protein CpaC
MLNIHGLLHRSASINLWLSVRLVVSVICIVAIPAYAAPDRPKLSEIIEVSNTDSQKVNIEIGQSLILDIPKGVRTIYVSEPALLDTTLKNANQLAVSGRIAGTTDLYLQDETGNNLASYRVFIKRNLALLYDVLRTAAPHLDLKLQATGRGMILTGDVASEIEANRIEQVVRSSLSSDELSGFVNQLTIRESDQVMIKLTIAEVQHSILKQLGVKTTGSWTVGNTNFSGKGSTSITDGVGTIAANVGGKELFSLQALEREGVLRTLAEPTLTAISGGEAKFVAGGQIPILGTFSYVAGVATRSIIYKDVGVELNFKPVVISSGRIRLTISSVVNELDPSLAYTFDGITYPGFRRRNMDTVVELPSGAALMTAGLLQQQSTIQIQGVPGLLNIPVIGALFRSREFQRKESELMIVVTPFIAKSTKPDIMPLPTDAFRLTDDASQMLQSQMVKKYGASKHVGSRQTQNTSQGVGFITK